MVREDIVGDSQLGGTWSLQTAVGRCAHKSRVLEQLFCGDCFHVAGPCVRSTFMLLDVLLAWCMSHSSDVADLQQFALRQSWSLESGADKTREPPCVRWPHVTGGYDDRCQAGQAVFYEMMQQIRAR